MSLLYWCRRSCGITTGRFISDRYHHSAESWLSYLFCCL